MPSKPLPIATAPRREWWPSSTNVVYNLSRNLNRVPGFRCFSPEGAFYAWVNIAETGISAEEICRIMLQEAGVAAIPGAAFGPEGKDFVRFSFASSVATLQEAVARIQRVSMAWQSTAAVR